MVELGRIAQLLLAEGGSGEFGFKRYHAIRICCRLLRGLSGERQHVSDVVHILLAQGDRLGVTPQVVALFR